MIDLNLSEEQKALENWTVILLGRRLLLWPLGYEKEQAFPRDIVKKAHGAGPRLGTDGRD